MFDVLRIENVIAFSKKLKTQMLAILNWELKKKAQDSG